MAGGFGYSTAGSRWTNPIYTNTMQVFISYLEIYNEIGYDLLDPTREVQAMEDLPQASTPPSPAAFVPWPVCVCS